MSYERTQRSLSRGRTTIALCSLGLVACAGRAAPSVHALPPDPELALSDPTITRAVERELDSDPAIPSGALLVSTKQRVVTLDGTVPSLLARAQAVQQASSVRGVRAVMNLVKVSPEQTCEDSQLEQQVRDALRSDAATAGERLDIDVDQGVAFVRGEVDSQAKRELIEVVASAVTGLRSIRNGVTIARRQPRTDESLRREITARLHWDALANTAQIRVHVNAGRVVLEGTVGSAAEKARVEHDGWVSGVKDVDVQTVDTAWWAIDVATREAPVRVSDWEIEIAVRAALHYDPRTVAYPLRVDSIDGLVVIGGEVASLSAKDAAQQAAEATIGVSEVRNQILVRGKATSDADTAKRLQQAFARHPYLTEQAISVEVERGTAHLRGRVASSFERAVAEQVAARHAGLVEVDNGLQVEAQKALSNHEPYGYVSYALSRPQTERSFRPAKPLSDAEIAQRIRRELLWNPLVDASRVGVDVKDGVATLGGSVICRAEMLAAVNNALQGGALRVDNQLQMFAQRAEAKSEQDGAPTVSGPTKPKGAAALQSSQAYP